MSERRKAYFAEASARSAEELKARQADLVRTQKEKAVRWAIKEERKAETRVRHEVCGREDNGVMWTTMRPVRDCTAGRLFAQERRRRAVGHPGGEESGDERATRGAMLR